MRPLPHIPRGPRRPLPATEALLLGCPRVSPEWELSALRALIKPQMGSRIRHRSGLQTWPAGADAQVRAAASACAERLDFEPTIHMPETGDYFLIANIPRRQLEEAKALAVMLSRRLPELWFVLGRLNVRNGRFFRRRFGYKLELRHASNVHVRRDIRTALSGMI